jgi:hypothetical protein
VALESKLWQDWGGWKVKWSSCNVFPDHWGKQNKITVYWLFVWTQTSSPLSKNVKCTFCCSETQKIHSILIFRYTKLNPQWVAFEKVVVKFFQFVKLIFLTTNEPTFQPSETRRWKGVSKWSEKQYTITKRNICIHIHW